MSDASPRPSRALTLARQQWERGDWEGLLAWDQPELAKHPDRGELLLLCAGGYWQLNQSERFYELVPKALQWGASRMWLKQLFLSNSNNEKKIKKSADYNEYLFYLLLKINNFNYKINFTPADRKFFKIENNILFFHLPTEIPGYLISNESGDFNITPYTNQLPLDPDTAYELSCYISNQDGDPPIFWFFEYINGIKVTSRSFKTKDNFVRAYFRTHPKLDSCAIGLRLGGEGQLNLNKTYLNLQSGENISLLDSVVHTIGEVGQSIESSISKKQKQQNDNNLFQLECFIRLQHYMGGYIVMPDMHGWPISPDLGLLLVRLVEMGQYDAIIEFGSGVSTLIVAQALTKAKLKSIDTSETTDTNFLSFEHLELYFEQTTAFLEQAGLQAIAQLHLTPLVPYEAPDRRIYSYYNCLGLLEQLRAQLKSKSNKSKLLVLVDGPPAATGPRARYPALPILQKVFGDQVEIHILMDDYIRDDERQIVAAWQALQTSNTRVTKEEFSKLEKQACLLKITHSQS